MCVSNLYQASRPTVLPPNIRDTLYHGLPNNIKSALPSRMQSIDAMKEVCLPSTVSPVSWSLDFYFFLDYAKWKIFFSSPSLRSKLKWTRLCSGSLHLPQIQSSKIFCKFKNLMSPYWSLIFKWLYIFCIDVSRRAHQGFGWVGEWANTRLVFVAQFCMENRMNIIIVFIEDNWS